MEDVGSIIESPTALDLKPDLGSREDGDKEGGRIAILFSSKDIGGVDSTLNGVLYRNFFYALAESVPSPRWVIFIGSAVHLVSRDSPFVDSVKMLQRDQTEVLACSTSLNHYRLELGVGLPTNIYQIVEILLKADKVITI